MFYKYSLKGGCRVCVHVHWEQILNFLCVFVRDRKSESVSDQISTCCWSWQAEQAGLTQFDWCLSVWRPLMASSFLVCLGSGSSLWTSPSGHTHLSQILHLWLSQACLFGVTELGSKHAFTARRGRMSHRYVHSKEKCPLQHSLKSVKLWIWKLYIHVCLYSTVQVWQNEPMYSIHHLLKETQPSTRG